MCVSISISRPNEGGKSKIQLVGICFQDEAVWSDSLENCMQNDTFATCCKAKFRLISPRDGYHSQQWENCFTMKTQEKKKHTTGNILRDFREITFNYYSVVSGTFEEIWIQRTMAKQGLLSFRRVPVRLWLCVCGNVMWLLLFFCICFFIMLRFWS